MCAKKEEEEEQEEEDCSQQAMNQNFQQQLLIQQQITNQQTTQASTSSNNGSGFIFPQVNDGQDWLFNPMMSRFPNPTRDLDPFLFPPPPPPSPIYGSFFNRRALGYEGLASTSAAHHHHHHQEHLRILSEALGPVVQTGSGPFGFQTEIGKMTAQEIMDAKALAASKSHSEAERRRRERINNHLARLRSLLPNTTKTDKASLLAEVIQHVKELKRQTSVIAETNPIPTETDELTVDTSDEEDGKYVIKVSLCCEDRSDLLPDLVKTLKSLRLKTLRAEITAIAGRVRNVLFVTTEDGSNDDQEFCVSSIKEALKTVMEKSGSADESSSGNTKRQRTVNACNVIEQQHPNRSL